MESPFFLSDWFLPTVEDLRRIPVKHRNTSSPAPKVMSIPVQFIGSEQSRSDLALMIQKVFRGFLVRKSLKKIAAIRQEVDAIGKRISTEETIELMRKDSKERLKMSETLMSLLFRLDSVKGVDSGVKDCRKKVIKKVIGLQEMVDSIVVAGNQFRVTIDAVVDSDNAKIICQDNSQEREADAIHPIQEQGEGPDLKHSASSSTVYCVDKVAEQQTVTEATRDTGEPEQANSRSVDECGEESMGTSQTESQSGSPTLHQGLIGGCEVGNIDNTFVKQEDKQEMKFTENIARGTEENNRSSELLERMLVDNEKMMGLIADLFERNQMQTRLLCSLLRRVEQLERAFTSGQKRKKKRNVSGAVDYLDSCQDTKMCGKRE